MLDPIVQIQLLQVEFVLPVTLIQQLRRVVRNEEAERRREVVRLSDERVQLAEGDVPAVVREDA